NLTGEFDLADAEGTALARRAEPTQEEAKHLPQRIDAETAGHHRIAFEMAGEEPKVGFEGEHRSHQPLSVVATLFRDLGNAVEHEHGWQRQLRPLAKQLAASAGQQIFIVEA